MKHLFIIIIFCGVLSGCTNKETTVESKYELVKENIGHLGYQTSSDGSKILMHDAASRKFLYINKDTGDTTLMNKWFGFDPILSPKGDSILYIENFNTLKMYDILQDSSFTLYKGDTTFNLFLSDWSEQRPEKVLLESFSSFSQKKNTEIYYYDINKKSHVILKKHDYIDHEPYSRFNVDATKIGYTDLNSDGEWTTMVLDLESKDELEFKGERFLGWVYSPEGLMVTKKINQHIVPFYIPMSNTKERIQIATKIEPHFWPHNSYGTLYLETKEHETNIEIITLENNSVSNTEETELNISWHSKAAWKKSGDDFYYFNGTGENHDIFEIREYFNNNSIVLTPNQFSRFGGHAANIEVSPDGKKILVQARAPSIDDLPRNGGIHVYDIENDDPEVLFYSGSRCPSDCFEWPTWLNSNDIVYAKWESNGVSRSISMHNIETGIDSTLLSSSENIGIAHLSASPDEKNIAYISWLRNEKTYNLNILDLALGQERTLASFDSIAQHGYRQAMFEITWSNGSEMIYYSYTDIKTTPQLIIGSITKTGIKNTLITREGEYYPFGLDMNPKGDKLLLTKGKNIEKTRNLYRLDVLVNQ